MAARMNGLLTRLWRLGKPLQWRFLWLMHAKFICGVTGVVRDQEGRVLLLRHRLWPPSRQWGFPTGYANKGERHEDTIIREVREETGLSVKPGRLLMVRSGYKYRIEVYYEAALTGGLGSLVLDNREVLEARLFSPDELPEGMPDSHRELAVGLAQRGYQQLHGTPEVRWPDRWRASSQRIFGIKAGSATSVRVDGSMSEYFSRTYDRPSATDGSCCKVEVM
jgi:8-oxo-dGTP diphosphatase